MLYLKSLGGYLRSVKKIKSMTPGLTFSQKTVLREVNIRGRVMTFATEIELLLIKVILFSIYNPDEDILRSFVRMTMGKKIETAIKDLQKYKPEVYVEYSHLFDSLSKLVEFRNHMAHCQMAWNEDNPSYITVIDFEKIQGVRNACKVMPVTYTLMEI